MAATQALMSSPRRNQCDLVGGWIKRTRAIIVGGEAFEALGYVVDRCVSRSLRMSSGGRVVLVPVIVVIP